MKLCIDMPPAAGDGLGLDLTQPTTKVKGIELPDKLKTEEY